MSKTPSKADLERFAAARVKLDRSVAELKVAMDNLAKVAPDSPLMEICKKMYALLAKKRPVN